MTGRGGCTNTVQLCTDHVPEHLAELLERVAGVDVPTLSRHHIPPPEGGGRPAAVLVLFGEGPDVLLLERSADLRNHPGQVSFPGGGIERTDSGPVAAALREAEEETGLDPAGVVPLALLPELFLPPSGFVVTPVLAHWRRPVAVRAVDPRETARVVRVPVAALADPRNRLRVSHPSGFVGPAFRVAGLLVWGFTGGLLSALLHLGGWERPWGSTQEAHDLGAAWSAARTAGQEVAGS